MLSIISTWDMLRIILCIGQAEMTGVLSEHSLSRKPNIVSISEALKRASVLLCKSIAKNKMRHFLAPSGQPKMMRKNFMHSDCCQLSWCAILRMKFYARKSTKGETL